MRGRTAALLATALAAGCSHAPPPAPRPDVLLVVVDTLRADGLSLYGNPLPTSPHLDRLAADGIVFEEALSQSAETAPSHATLFTGLLPWVHRVANLRLPERPTPGLEPAFDTLAERFGRGGYQTAAITDGGPLGTAWSLQQGFEHHRGKLEGVEAKVDQALELLEHGRDGRPLFLFLHTYQVHQPYVAPLEWAHRFTPTDYDGPLRAAEEEMRRALDAGTLRPDGTILLRDRDAFDARDVDYLRRLYYGEIAYTDHHLQRLWSFLAERGALDATVVAVTSDHGEEFGEHGHYGHRQLYRESLHVPLVLRLPADLGIAAPRRPSGRVSLVDLHRTLLEAAELPCPDWVQGRSLLELLRSGEDGADEPHPSYALTTDPHWGRDVWRQGVRFGTRALLRRLQDGEARVELFDLEADAEERRPLPLAEPGVPARLARELGELLDAEVRAQEDLRAALLEGRDPAEWDTADGETLEELEVLGYLGED